MEIRSIRTPGLGDATYVLAHEGLGILVDPQRDVERFLAVAGELDVELRWVLETHLHNDYVSGGRDAAAAPAPSWSCRPRPSCRSGTRRRSTPRTSSRVRSPSAPSTPPVTPPSTRATSCSSRASRWRSSPVGPSSSGGRSQRSARPGPRGRARAGAVPLGAPARAAARPGRAPPHPRRGLVLHRDRRRTHHLDDRRRRRRRTRSSPTPTRRRSSAGELTGLEPYPRYYAHMGPANLAGPEPLAATDASAAGRGRSRRAPRRTCRSSMRARARRSPPATSTGRSASS
jgi:hydroxyacylglutathione hydrolase